MIDPKKYELIKKSIILSEKCLQSLTYKMSKMLMHNV